MTTANIIIGGIVVCVVAFIIVCLLYVVGSMFINNTWLPYKNAVYDNDFSELLAILKLLINSEIEEYETDVFLSKETISNSNFDHYYKDICKKIQSNLSPALEQQLLKYMSERMLYTTIARAVKKFLTEKIHGTL